MHKFSNINSLEYALLSWYLYLNDLKKRRKRTLWNLLNKNLVPAYEMQKNLQNLMLCKESTRMSKEIGFLLLEAGKIPLRKPDKYGISHAYDIDKMINKLRSLVNHAEYNG